MGSPLDLDIGPCLFKFSWSALLSQDLPLASVLDPWVVQQPVLFPAIYVGHHVPTTHLDHTLRNHDNVLVIENWLGDSAVSFKKQKGKPQAPSTIMALSFLTVLNVLPTVLGAVRHFDLSIVNAVVSPDGFARPYVACTVSNHSLHSYSKVLSWPMERFPVRLSQSKRATQLLSPFTTS